MAPFNFGKKDSSHWNPTIALSPKPAKQAKGGQSYTSSSAYACPEFSIPTWVHKWSKPLYQGIALGPYNTCICNRTSPGTVPSLPSPLHIYNTQIHCVHPNSQLECAHLQLLILKMPLKTRALMTSTLPNCPQIHYSSIFVEIILQTGGTGSLNKLP